MITYDTLFLRVIPEYNVTKSMCFRPGIAKKLENIPDEIILRYIGKKGGICTVLLMNWS